jgi:hypothetical protein
MILRHVVAHFRKQEWTAIFLDFVIVVAGILIAFQITEWNDARRDHALEREYLERLYVDLQESLDAQARRVDWDVTRRTQQAFVLKSLRSGKLADADRETFETGLAFFGFGNGFDVQWSTVEELQSTGAMSLIRDVSLRSRILSLDADLRRRKGIGENFMQSIYAFREQLGDRYGVVNYNGERDHVELAYDFDALAADPGVANLLSQIEFLSRFRQDLVETTLDEVALLKDEIGKRLGLEAGETPQLGATE